MRSSHLAALLVCLLPSALFAQIEITIENGGEKVRIGVPQGSNGASATASSLGSPADGFPPGTFMIEQETLPGVQKDSRVSVDMTRSLGNANNLLNDVKVIETVPNLNGKSTYYLATTSEEYSLLSQLPKGSLKLRLNSQPITDKPVVPSVEVIKADESEDEGKRLRQYLKWKTLGEQSGLSHNEIMLLKAILPQDAIVIEKNYLLNSNPIATQRLDLAKKVVKERHGDLVLQVFLEDPKADERLMLAAEKNAKMFSQITATTLTACITRSAVANSAVSTF